MQAMPTKLNPKSRLSLVAVTAYILIFLTMRLINLKLLPVFGDETIHIIRAQSTLEGDLFIGLRDGLKQLYIWLAAVSFLFFDDQLLIARIISVLAGLVGGGVCYKLTTMLYPSRSLGYLAALFYLLSPFALFHDRMALTDSLLTMLMGASLLFSIQLWRHPSVKWALALGLVFGLAALTKAYAALYYPTPILLWFLFGKKIRWSKVAKLMSIVYATTLLAWIPIFTIGWGIYDTTYSQKTILASSTQTGLFDSFWNNVLLEIEWLSIYLTWPFVALLFFTLAMIIIKRDRPGFLLIILMLEILLSFAAFFTLWYPRFLLPLLVPLSVMFAWGIDNLTKLVLLLVEKGMHKRVGSSISYLALQGGIFLACCIPVLSFDYSIITTPLQAPVPVLDKWQYFAGPYAGYGLEESAQVINEAAEQYPNLRVLRGRYALDSIGMSLYLSDPEKVSIEIINDFDASIIQRLDTYTQEGPVFTITTSDLNKDNGFTLPNGYRPPQAWQVASFPKPTFQTEFESYQWLRLPEYAAQDMLNNSQMKIDLYQWLLPSEFAIRWFQQGGDTEPRLAWFPSDKLSLATDGVLLEWPKPADTTLAAVQQALAAADVEYVLATPELIKSQPDLFAPFMTTEGSRLFLKQLPPDWRLAFVYPDVNCQWCLFQLKPPDHPTQITFSQNLELEGYDVSATELSSGESLHTTLYWNSLETLSESYLVFVHLMDTNGRLVGQVDEPPLQGKWPIHNWRPGDRLADRHTLRLAPTLPAGDYILVVGLYNPANLERMPAHSEQNLVSDNAVTLTTLSIKLGGRDND